MEVLEEDSSMGMEKELEESHTRQCLKEIKDRRENGLYQQVLQEGMTVW